MQQCSCLHCSNIICNILHSQSNGYINTHTQLHFERCFRLHCALHTFTPSRTQVCIFQHRPTYMRSHQSERDTRYSISLKCRSVCYPHTLIHLFLLSTFYSSSPRSSICHSHIFHALLLSRFSRLFPISCFSSPLVLSLYRGALALSPYC